MADAPPIIHSDDKRSNNTSDNRPKLLLIQMLLPVNSLDFWGRLVLQDQVLWRRRAEDEVFVQVLDTKDGKRYWDKITFAKLADYGHGQSWDGNIYLALESTENWPEFLHLKKKYIDQKDIEKKLKNSLTQTLPLLREGRAVVCSSFEGRWTSITVRGESPSEKASKKVRRGELDAESLPTVLLPRQWAFEKSKWKANDDPSDEFLFTFADYIRAIKSIIFDISDNTLLDSPVSGLVVIMGETGSGKSQIAYGLMHQYLELRLNAEASEDQQKTFFHVVTLEDPIEKLLSGTDPPYPESLLQAPESLQGMDYTARHKLLDTTLKDGLTDALRQKPVVVYVGEIREREDWKAVIEFAGTGHLVVATAHAGSLSEAISKILDACNADTPAERGEVGRKILAMIQLTPTEVSSAPQTQGQKAKDRNVTLMTLWQRENGGVSKLVSEGLSSLVPHRDRFKGTIGAQGMCEVLLSGLSKKTSTKKTKIKPFQDNLKAKALEHDLHGI